MIVPGGFSRAYQFSISAHNALVMVEQWRLVLQMLFSLVVLRKREMGDERPDSNGVFLYIGLNCFSISVVIMPLIFCTMTG